MEWFDRLDEPFSEHADPVHVTASAIVVSARGVLLHLHKRLGIWIQPGGHIDPGELPWDAAVRETREETGLEVRHAAGHPHLVHVDVHQGGRGHLHLDLRYLLVADEQDPAPPEGESQQVEWCDWDTAIGRCDAGLAGALVALRPVDGASILVRPATDDDAGALGELYLRSRAHALPGIEPVHGDDETRRWLADHLLRTTDVWVAEVAGVCVGLLALADHWVEQLSVDPPWIGRGIGSRLIDEAMRLSPEQLELWTFQHNDRARGFYRRHGFVEVELTDGLANEERLPDVRMSWSPATPDQ